jgi:hypothetical protein
MMRNLLVATVAVLLGSCAGSAICPVGLTQCSSACVDVSINRSHCGTCGTACMDGELCVDGTCTPQVLEVPDMLVED